MIFTLVRVFAESLKIIGLKEKARAAVKQALEQRNAELADEEDDGEELELRKKQFGKAP